MRQNYQRLIVIIFLLVSLLVYFGFTTNQSQLSQGFESEEKQKGVHVFGHLDSLNVQPLLENNFDWITLVPYAGQKNHNSPDIRHSRGDSARMLRRNASWLTEIKLLHESGFKVFVKPHIWLNEPESGKWRSDIFPTNMDNWESWKKSYRQFIFRWAKIAEEGQAEMFCIGTELTRLTSEKPEFWKALIKDVRKIYSGKVTYAANWYQEYEQISFWEDLDYIGIQAYFPLVKRSNPSVQQISKGWEKYMPDIRAISEKYHRKVLFTELGYKSTADAAAKPWEWIDYSALEDKTASNTTQVNCYQGFFDTVWDQDWFAGVHIWQWRSDFAPDRRGRSHLDFTPQGKPAAEIIAKGFE